MHKTYLVLLVFLITGCTSILQLPRAEHFNYTVTQLDDSGPTHGTEYRQNLTFQVINSAVNMQTITASGTYHGYTPYENYSSRPITASSLVIQPRTREQELHEIEKLAHKFIMHPISDDIECSIGSTTFCTKNGILIFSRRIVQYRGGAQIWFTENPFPRDTDCDRIYSRWPDCEATKRAASYNPATCQVMEADSYWSIVGECYYFFAQQQKNDLPCAKPGDLASAWCYRHYATLTKNPDICGHLKTANLFGTETSADRCLYEVAQASHNESVCDSIIEPYTKETCYWNCEHVKNQTIQDSCYSRQARIQNNSALCAYAGHGKDLCYYSFAECEHITASTSFDSCLKFREEMKKYA